MQKLIEIASLLEGVEKEIQHALEKEMQAYLCSVEIHDNLIHKIRAGILDDCRCDLLDCIAHLTRYIEIRKEDAFASLEKYEEVL